MEKNTVVSYPLDNSNHKNIKNNYFLYFFGKWTKYYSDGKVMYSEDYLDGQK